MTKKEKMNFKINLHGNNLLKLFPNCKEQDPVKLCKKLFRLENRAHKIATDWCNGVRETNEIDAFIAPIFFMITGILGEPSDKVIFFNGDARGYALKIKPDFVRAFQDGNIYTDMGGYGILAPDFRE